MKSLFVAYQEIGPVEKFGVFNQSHPTRVRNEFC